MDKIKKHECVITHDQICSPLIRKPAPLDFSLPDLPVATIVKPDSTWRETDGEKSSVK
jgi:hypothetical protein